MNSYKEQAIAKLREGAKGGSFGQKAAAMKSAVLDALIDFSGQDTELAQAVVQGGSFADCMKAVEKGVGQSISDIDAYARAVQFYFPGAKIRFSMTLDFIGDAAKGRSGIVLDFSDFL